MKFLIIILALTCFISCKKDEVTVCEEPVYSPNVAPCEIAELNYNLDSVFYGPSDRFPEAKFRVKFIDTIPFWGQTMYSVEFAFNKIPTTGMYHMMYDIDTNILDIIPNQMAYVRDSGFINVSTYTQAAEVYIENNENELIISYCNISNYMASMDFQCNCNLGNMMRNVKVRRQH